MNSRFWFNVDWLTVFVFVALMVFGWVNIVAAEYDVTNFTNVFDLDKSYGKQFMWLVVSIGLAIITLIIDARFYSTFSNYIFAFTILLLILTLLLGRPINGAVSWIQIGPFSLQPSEFAKTGTILAIAKYLEGHGVSIVNNRHKLVVLGIMALPVGLISLQPDFGSAMVFFALIIMLYREGLHWIYLALPAWLGLISIASMLVSSVFIVIGVLIFLAIIAIYYTRKNFWFSVALAGFSLVSSGVSFGVNYVVENVLPTHHKNRIYVLLGKIEDPNDLGYNVHQSLIAIGSGGFDGKGWLQGTQTTGGFVPEQNTDFIFCTVGEEFGWIGTTAVIMGFAVLLFRLIMLAERQRTKFARIYGYGVVSIIFFHVLVNIAMTVGLFPIIGIPLPLFSYGGSSLMSFAVMVFI
ncbi:MAG: rod shape-determining protein RodA, partial [Bacteroidetes bacterium]|nr:rod shape-determining protein RodA [Bacteroidota bacterium]